MRETVVVVTEPAYEPITRAQAKEWLRIDADDTAHDSIVDMLIQAMREDAEDRTGRAFISRQLKLYLETWPMDAYYGSKIVLPHPPLIGVDAFQYIDTDGDLQTLADDQYEVHTEYEPGFIIPVHTISWPAILQRPDALQITFTAGYPVGSPTDEASYQENMPAKLKLWMESKIASHNEFREQIVAGVAVNEIPRDFTDSLLDGLVIGSRLF